MKTSTLIATVAIAGAFVLLTAANLKIKNEYTKGNLKDAFVKRPLASFRFIKDNTDSSTLKKGRFDITVANGNKPGVSSYYDEKSVYLFTVSNDTLYITTDQANKDLYNNGALIIISTNQLNKLDVAQGSFSVSSSNRDSLSVIAGERSDISIKISSVQELMALDKEKRKFSLPPASLSIVAKGRARVSLETKDTLNNVSIRLDDKSTFIARDVVMKHRKLQLGNQANLQLSGRSIENFGLKNVE